MSLRGICHGNAIGETFLSSLKRKRIRCRTQQSHEEARRDAFDGIAMLQTAARKQVITGCWHPHNSNGNRSRKQNYLEN